MDPADPVDGLHERHRLGLGEAPAPFQAHESTGGNPARARGLITAGKGSIATTLEALGREAARGSWPWSARSR